MIKKLNVEQLQQICSELREYIIDQLSHNPGICIESGNGRTDRGSTLSYNTLTTDWFGMWDIRHIATKY